MARLYADEDFPFPVVERLRQLGHDVRTALEAGQANQAIADAPPHRQVKSRPVMSSAGRPPSTRLADRVLAT